MLSKIFVNYKIILIKHIRVIQFNFLDQMCGFCFIKYINFVCAYNIFVCFSSLCLGFSILDTAPNSHKFKLTMFQPTDPKYFFKTVRNEIKLLRTSLPQGIWVKGFEDRMVS